MSVLKTEKPTAIQSIAAHEFLRQRSFDLVTLQRGQPLETAGVAAENAFFLVSGVCCHVLPFANRNVVTAVVGKGEMTGCSIVLGSPVSSSTVVVKMESRAFKVSRAELLAFCQESETFAASLLVLLRHKMWDLIDHCPGAAWTSLEVATECDDQESFDGNDGICYVSLGSNGRVRWIDHLRERQVPGGFWPWSVLRGKLPPVGR